MFENGSLLRRRKRFKLHKTQKDILNDELAALANINRFFFQPNAEPLAIDERTGYTSEAISPQTSPAPIQTISPKRPLTPDSPTVIGPESSDLVMATTTTTTSSAKSLKPKTKRAFTIESLITPDKRAEKHRKTNNSELRMQSSSAHQPESSPQNVLPSIHTRLPPINQALPFAPAVPGFGNEHLDISKHSFESGNHPRHHHLQQFHSLELQKDLSGVSNLPFFQYPPHSMGFDLSPAAVYPLLMMNPAALSGFQPTAAYFNQSMVQHTINFNQQQHPLNNTAEASSSNPLTTLLEM